MESAGEPAKPSPPTAIKTTESMVTVRLSDAEIPALPSPTPTLKLVDEKSKEFLLDDKEPRFVPERSESPISTDLSIPITTGDDVEKTENKVDWEGLEKTEGEHTKVEGSEEVEPPSPCSSLLLLDAEEPVAKKPVQGTEFLLARLEQENKRLEQDPKALHTHPDRPPSLAKLRQMMANPDPNTLRYSMLPAKLLLTDLDFYAAVVADYNRAASRLPVLLSTKIRGGIPPPLRGVVWIAASGARDCNLEGLYDQLLGESSPYDQLIGKDVGRTGLDMFKQEGGEGQRMLGRVLRAFSVYDSQIGYCQGLGFLVGPLLMHMQEKEAFCVLVRLMEFYDLRSCFMPDLYGLHLRMFQFTELLAAHLPQLSNHLTELGIQPTYASQWFLSFFAVSCPLPMLFRIYDVIFAEGAPETIMRVALSLMRRNEKRLLATAEFEDVMQMLLSRSLWDTYSCNADDLVQDFVGFSGIVTKATLTKLETKFTKASTEEAAKLAPAKSQATDLQAAASRFLGRLWGGPSQGAVSLSPINLPSRRSSNSLMARTPSKQSLSTVSSYETNATIDSSSSDSTANSRWSSYTPSTDDRRHSTRSISSMRKAVNRDGELHGQIEDLLLALSALQREHAQKIEDIAAVKQSRQEERTLTKRLIQLLSAPDETPDSVSEISDLCDTISLHFTSIDAAAAAEAATSAALAAELTHTKSILAKEQTKSKNLSHRLASQDADVSQLKSQLSEVKGKFQDLQASHRKLEHSMGELKRVPLKRASTFNITSPIEDPGTTPAGGLRELRLGRANSQNHAKKPSTAASIFSKRSSSFGMATILAQSSQQQGEESLVAELVAAKNAEAVAKLEAEEAKAKLESLRKVLLGKSSGPTSPGFAMLQPAPEGGGSGGWFGGGWGVKRSASSAGNGEGRGR